MLARRVAGGGGITPQSDIPFPEKPLVWTQPYQQKRAFVGIAEVIQGSAVAMPELLLPAYAVPPQGGFAGIAVPAKDL